MILIVPFKLILNGNGSDDVKKRVLGKSGIKVSPMGMGCWAIGGPMSHYRSGVIGYGEANDELSIKAVRKGIEQGVTFFDTANAYGCGRSEKVLGKALKSYREDVTIATKFATTWEVDPASEIPCKIVGSDASPEAIHNACNASLRRLQTDYIDLYQLHDGDLEIEKAREVRGVLEELVKAGKIRYYGWSTDSPERAAFFAEGKHCAAVQFRHNLMIRNNTMLEDVLEKYDVAGIVKGPLGYGVYTGKYTPDTSRPSNHMLHNVDFTEGSGAKALKMLDDMKTVLTADGRTIAQGALGWIWATHDRLIPIPGFKTIEQVEENTNAMEYGPLTEQQLEDIDRIRTKYQEE